MMRNKDMDFEIRFFEGVLHRVPGFIAALIALGDLYTRRGYYAKGLNVDLKLAALMPQDPVVLYNLACSYSLLNQLPNALGALRKALVCGYDEFDYLRQDEDLAQVRSIPEFEVLLKEFTGKKVAGCQP